MYIAYTNYQKYHVCKLYFKNYLLDYNLVIPYFYRYIILLYNMFNWNIKIDCDFNRIIYFNRINNFSSRIIIYNKKETNIIYGNYNLWR